MLLAVAAATASAATRVGFDGCRGYTAAHPKAIARPTSIVIYCADGNGFLTGLHWSTWGASSATGTGTLHLNDCTPNCAAGKFKTYAATAKLSAPKACKGATVFTKLEWTQVGKKPATMTFGCS